jgi:aerobic C4-dicarboxylate transport protein
MEPAPGPNAPPGAKPPLYRVLYVQVLFAIACGVLLGHLAPSTAVTMKPLGDGFIKLIKMVIAPVIFTTVVLGIAGSEDLKRVGRTGGLALVYFEVVSTFALIVGLIVVNTLQPGAGSQIGGHALGADRLNFLHDL